MAEAVKEPFSDLLDAGCGTGAMLGMFQRDYPDRNYTGVDLSEKMIETANKKHIDEICFVAGDCENLPFADKCFINWHLSQKGKMQLNVQKRENIN